MKKELLRQLANTTSVLAMVGMTASASTANAAVITPPPLGTSGTVSATFTGYDYTLGMAIVTEASTLTNITLTTPLITFPTFTSRTMGAITCPAASATCQRFQVYTTVPQPASGAVTANVTYSAKFSDGSALPASLAATLGGLTTGAGTPVPAADNLIPVIPTIQTTNYLNKNTKTISYTITLNP